MPGPAPIAEWNVRYDQSDPLLYIESLPYWETRGYVPIVLRNYWIYEDARAATARRAAGRSPQASGRASPAFPAPAPSGRAAPAAGRPRWATRLSESVLACSA